MPKPHFMKPRLFMPTRRLKGDLGFTLIELIVTLTVLVITLSLAAPSFSAFLANNQLASAKSEFASTLALARSEAARSGNMVFIQAAPGGASGNEFGPGWDLYADVDGNGVLDGADTLLRHHEALPRTVRLGGSASIRFNASGSLAPAAPLTYSACRNDGSPAGFSIVIEPAGTSFVRAVTTC